MSIFRRTILFLLFLSVFSAALGQIRPQNGRGGGQTDALDSLRKIDDQRQDTVIFTSKYIRYTDLEQFQEGTITKPIDTTIQNFENYSPVYQPEKPTVNLGGLGLAYREMLFDPSKRIGFDVGFHSLDAYLLTQDSIHYYRARTPYTELYFMNGSGQEQLFRVTHSQNVKPNWNVGANYFRNASDGYYKNQNANHLNAAIFTWYESENKRYNLLVNGLFNTLKPAENGSTVRDVFEAEESISHNAEKVKLAATDGNRARQEWRQKNFFLKHFYYIGRIDSLRDSTGTKVLPTQRLSHTFSFTSDEYKFISNEEDVYGVFPQRRKLNVIYPGGLQPYRVRDSTIVKNLRNEFSYSFYLRGGSVKFIKNELKLELGLQHDIYRYQQMDYHDSFQSVTLKARPGYRFSDRVSIDGNLQQIAQGPYAGDYLYEANASFLLSNSVGRIVLGAYTQNQSPSKLYERADYTFQQWDHNFDRTKVNNLSFAYQNDKFKTRIKAEYFLLTDYLYYRESDVFPLVIVPGQIGTNINLLKVSLKKGFTFGRFNSEHYFVYQKTDFQDVLRTPELYAYNSLYYGNTFFKAVYADLGFDIRYNTPFKAPSYDINLSQFYNGPELEFANYPVLNVWLRASLKRASLFVKYDYLNQGWFNKGYYTVNRYPMNDALLKFGVSWKFYD